MFGRSPHPAGFPLYLVKEIIRFPENPQAFLSGADCEFYHKLLPFRARFQILPFSFPRKEDSFLIFFPSGPDFSSFPFPFLGKKYLSWICFPSGPDAEFFPFPFLGKQKPFLRIPSSPKIFRAHSFPKGKERKDLSKGI